MVSPTSRYQPSSLNFSYLATYACMNYHFEGKMFDFAASLAHYLRALLAMTIIVSQISGRKKVTTEYLDK